MSMLCFSPCLCPSPPDAEESVPDAASEVPPGHDSTFPLPFKVPSVARRSTNLTPGYTRIPTLDSVFQERPHPPRMLPVRRSACLPTLHGSRTTQHPTKNRISHIAHISFTLATRSQPRGKMATPMAASASSPAAGSVAPASDHTSLPPVPLRGVVATDHFFTVPLNYATYAIDI